MSSDISTSGAYSADTCDRVIRVSNLGKFYRLYEKPEDRLKEFLFPTLDKWFGREPRDFSREFQALADVTFDVGKGETVGIIGRNGSGKSTLLQIISGTLTPSCGSVDVVGRVAALLELGSGFHPDFSGRDNVYMNAALYGLSPDEIDEQFDDIASFADIGRFIDQPVKTYSSGMMLRLAFAVIAHIEADILVIDEALSVGDAIFTQKCMRFIKAFQEKGTLLFVSHDMGAVKNLCQKTIWLDEGVVKAIGETSHVADAYLESTFQAIYGDDRQLYSIGQVKATTGRDVDREANDAVLDYEASVSVQDNVEGSGGWMTGGAEILSVSMTNTEDEAKAVLKGGERVCLKIKAIAYERLASPVLGFLVKDRLGQILFGENTLPFTADSPIELNSQDVFKAEFEFLMPMLPNGEYVVMASVADGDLHKNVQHHYLHDALVLTVSCSKVRWGLTGIQFARVCLEIIDE